jgi:hypothetical protein
MTSMPDDARIGRFSRWNTQHGREKAEIGKWTRLHPVTPGWCVQRRVRRTQPCHSASGLVDAVHHAVARPNRSGN